MILKWYEEKRRKVTGRCKYFILYICTEIFSVSRGVPIRRGGVRLRLNP